jgi:hypothetical protein
MKENDLKCCFLAELMCELERLPDAGFDVIDLCNSLGYVAARFAKKDDSIYDFFELELGFQHGFEVARENNQVGISLREVQVNEPLKNKGN